MSVVEKKQCVVVTCFSESQPGYLDFSYRIKSLAKHYKITILSQDQLTQSELMVSDADYHAFGRQNGKYGWLSYLWKCASYARKHKPDVLILLHSSASPITLMIRNIPICLYWNEHPTNLIHLPVGFSPIRYFLAIASHRLVFLGARYADSIMPIGEEHRDELYRHLIDHKKINMIYMGVSDAFLSCKELKQVERKVDVKQSVRLIYVGTVNKERGRDVMLESMAVLAKENMQVHLTIIGANEEQLKHCNQRADELSIKNMVTIVGRVPGESIPGYLAKADIGICLWEKTPWYEFNPPTKLFEYLVAGLPVLASNIRTHTRYVQDWNNGLIFDYDKDSLASAISILHTHKNRIQALKNTAAESGQQYLWSKLEPVFLQTISKLVNSKPMSSK